MKRFKIIVDTGFAGAQHEDLAEFEDEDWERMIEEEREAALAQSCQDAIQNCIDAYWEEIAPYPSDDA